jgi:ATP-dependent helicase/nuclease subunit B
VSAHLGDDLGDDNEEPTLAWVRYDQDALAYLAQHLVRRYAAQLPDLTQVTVLLPHPVPAPRLRRLLLAESQRAGYPALLGPHIATLGEWVRQRTYLNVPVLAEQARELTLVEALLGHSKLFGQAAPWSLAQDLLRLFDELTLRRIELPSTLTEFTQTLQCAYGVGDSALGALGREAQLVFTLWHAWHEQLEAEGSLDLTAAHVMRLGLTLSCSERSRRYYLVGFYDLSPAEQEWVRALCEQGQATLVLHGQRGRTGAYHPDTAMTELSAALKLAADPCPSEAPRSRFFDAVYALEGAAFAERAQTWAGLCPVSPLGGDVQVFEADDAEQEARAVDFRLRQWLVEGLGRIGIVTQDRRLARRLRALLERAGVSLADAAGWALSTTPAAAALERWLETLEEDFAYGPLLDVLKSPFVFPDQNRDEHLYAVDRLEQDIILHQNVARGLRRYRQHLRYRQAHLSGPTVQAVNALLQRVEQAARPLLRLSKGKRYAAQAFLMALQESLEGLGMRACLTEDPAGQRVLTEIDHLFQALGGRRLPISWIEFRTWLGHTLERFDYRPQAEHGAVELLNLEQSPLCRFDALVLAGLDHKHLPGPGHLSPFFNDAVRRELGLSISRDLWNARFYHFRRLLEAAPRVLLTVRREQAGEQVMPSPWLERLRRFHQVAYGDDLQDRALQALLAHPASQVSECDTQALPQPPPRPAPVLSPSLLPPVISTTGYQQLMDCPYRFYTRQCLGLAAPQEIREALEKSDYGERVHRSLEAFHLGVEGLPGPFSRPLNEATRAEATQLLRSIAEAVFAHDLEENFVHRGWLRRWLELIPAYLAWQLEREREWRVIAAEVKQTIIAGAQVQLEGRLDRIDEGPQGVAIIDYKTGSVPDPQDVDSGEAVQLPCYALLSDRPIVSAEYLRLDKAGLRRRVGLQGAPLERLKEQVRERLLTLWEAIQQGAPLPAWGDTEVCERCELSGVCRREAWADEVVGSRN